MIKVPWADHVSRDYKNEGGKTKNIHTVTENEISHNGFDLPMVQKLANSIIPPRTPIISGAKTDISSHYILWANISGNQDIACYLVSSDMNKVQHQTIVKAIANIP